MIRAARLFSQMCTENNKCGIEEEDITASISDQGVVAISSQKQGCRAVALMELASALPCPLYAVPVSLRFSTFAPRVQEIAE